MSLDLQGQIQMPSRFVARPLEVVPLRGDLFMERSVTILSRIMRNMSTRRLCDD